MDKKHFIGATMKKRLAISIILIAFVITILFPMTAGASGNQDGHLVFARVKTVENREEYNEEAGKNLIVQTIEVEVYSNSPLKGRTYTFDHTTGSDYYKRDMTLSPGDKIKVELYISEEGYLIQSNVFDIVRYPLVFWLIGLFIILLIIVGRKQGLKTALSMVITISAIVFVLLPLLKKGWAPIPLTIGICAVITIATFLITAGFTSKAFSAILGTCGGLIVAGLLSALVAHIAKMNGYSSEVVEFLIYNPQGTIYNLRGLLLAGILIGCLGAVMDVAMSISSSIYEIKQAGGHLSRTDLYKSGMRVGSDIIGTMSNTLILAYTGGSLGFILGIMAFDIPMLDVLNHDFIMAEVLRSIAGSIGIILTVPITAILAATLYARKKDAKES